MQQSGENKGPKQTEEVEGSNTCLKPILIAELKVSALMLYSTYHIEPHHLTHSPNPDFIKN
jgi:hypothetical protein